ncbi:MAG: glycerophosphodiester phosphodiesterase [Lachnospiraceae bacterium]|nr:glycerophosphodiester phosphodiesterase [Lachnospiraceae bacterium]
MRALIIVIIVVVVLLVLIGLYLLSIKPVSGKLKRARRKKAKPFMENMVAHRGLFDNKSSAPENTIPAFKNAVEKGYPIELDVQLTVDNKLIVFHDDNMQRVCGIDHIIYKNTFEEIRKYNILESEEKIPLFSEVLEAVDGKVPLLIEIKSAGNCINTAKALSKELENYDGIYAVESFNPLAVGWYKKHHPEILRGQLSTNFYRNKMPVNPVMGFFLSNMVFNFISKPDFIAFNYKYTDYPSYRIIKSLYKPLLACWTVRNKKVLRKVKKDFDMFIFDSFEP